MLKECIPGTYIYGKSEPFDEEMEFTFERLKQWLDLCDLKLEYIHTTGHCFPDDLKQIIETINPKNLIPIHTKYPNEFYNLISKDINVKIPKFSESIIL